MVPGWTEKGTGLDQVVEGLEIKKVPGWAEKGTRLIHKKIRYYIAILLLTAEPLSLENLMNAIGYSNKKSFRDNYIQPLIGLKFITRTELGSSPDQKYKLTPAGQMFLIK